MPDPRPLDGIRVLELGTFLAGPFTGTQFAEFGAEVIKVELPGVGDPTRRYGHMTESDSLVWLSEARNKKTISLDLRKAEGVEVARRLVAECDVVAENFQPGTLEGWGLGWETLRDIKPDLVMVRISGFGQTGPYRERPGFGRVGNAFGGLSYLAGYPDRPPVTPGSATIADYLAGLHGTLGALLALRHRDATGQGQVVDIGLYEPIFRILDELAPKYSVTGAVRGRVGPRSPNSAPHSHYETKDGRWLGIACTSDKIFARLAQLIGDETVAGDGKWGTVQQRQADNDALDDWVGAWTANMSRDEVIAACETAQVPCGPIYSIDEIFEDPQYAARGNILRVTDPRVGEIAVPNVVPRLTETPGRVDWLGPEIGEYNDEIYGQMLGMTQAQLDQLKAIGAI